MKENKKEVYQNERQKLLIDTGIKVQNSLFTVIENNSIPS